LYPYQNIHRISKYSDHASYFITAFLRNKRGSHQKLKEGKAALLRNKRKLSELERAEITRILSFEFEKIDGAEINAKSK